MTDQKLQVIPLGGLGEFGMNMTAIRYGDDIIVVDCRHDVPRCRTAGRRPGNARPHLPEGEPEHVRALILTHGHEDHIGAVPYLALRYRCPRLRHRFHAGSGGAAPGRARTGTGAAIHPRQAQADRGNRPFKIEFIHVTHSIVSAVALAITTPLGVILHTGDYKVDPTPTDNELFDLHTLADYGKRGVLLLLSDSTNSDRPG